MSQVLEIAVNKRVCKACKQEKPLAAFHFHKGNAAYMHKCEECFVAAERKRQKTLWESDPEYREAHNKQGQEHRKRIGWKDPRTIKDRVHYRYGVSWAFILETFKAQLGRCANMGCAKELSLDTKAPKAFRAVIDHDHATGAFRALLCGKCNLDLGMIETNEQRFLGLTEYLRKHKQHKE